MKNLNDNFYCATYFPRGPPRWYNYTMDKNKFMSFYKGTPNEKSASDCFDAVSDALDGLGILTPLTLVGVLSTVRVEVGRAFKPIEETYIAPGHAFVGATYEGRIDLGNIQFGDGNRFRGRGVGQITGRGNYTYYSKLLGVDLVNNPDLALGVIISTEILAHFFKDRGLNKLCDSKNWVLLRQRYNGGNGIDSSLPNGTTNGLNDFLNVVNQYLA